MKILITGAAGEIGTTLRYGLRGRYELLRLHDRIPISPEGVNEEAFTGDLRDYNVALRCVAEMDVIIHLAGVAREGKWDAIVQSNIQATINIFEAAQACGVKRVVFASTNHVIGFYRSKDQIGTKEPPRPDTRYAVSKVFGEALGRYHADKYGLSVICLRIGSFRKSVTTSRELMTWLSPDDCVRLAIASIEARNIHFEVIYGVSANDRRMWINDGSKNIGYVPQDNSERFLDSITPDTDSENHDNQFHGGFYAGLDFAGKTTLIE